MELAPKKISRMGSLWIVDLGQVIVGRVKLTARGPAGTSINVTHAEMLNPDGSLYTENLRTAISLDTFILKGDSQPETFEPQFTFHGFRYIGIAGYPGELTADNIRGVVIGSDTPDIGTFESSNAEVNQLYSNIRWGQRGNFVSIPTDCPQRNGAWDGWATHRSLPTAAYNANVASFFDKWLRDVNDAQNDAGAFNNVSPKANENQSYPVWADAGVLIPWVMYTTYGDIGFLQGELRSHDTLRGLRPANVPDPDRHRRCGRPPCPGAARGGAPRGASGAITTTTVVDTAYLRDRRRSSPNPPPCWAKLKTPPNMPNLRRTWPMPSTRISSISTVRFRPARKRPICWRFNSICSQRISATPPGSI